LVHNKAEIIHFINLVCWSSVDDVLLESSLKHEVFCDSISFKLVLSLIGFTCNRKPGSSIIPNDLFYLNRSDVLFITPYDMPQFSSYIICPNLENEIDYKNFAQTLFYKYSDKNINEIWIGISSPKQNKLALEILLLFKNPRIYCVGAALQDVNQGTNYKRWSRLGIEWIKRSFGDPFRSIKKIFQTVLAIIKIISSTKERNKLKLFAESYINKF
jgi:hypothetical protein